MEFRIVFFLSKHLDRVFFFFQAEDGIRDGTVTGVQTCALPISYYLRYFYAHDEVVREQQSAPSRAAEVAEIESKLLELYADPTLDEKPELLGQREIGRASCRERV